MNQATAKRTAIVTAGTSAIGRALAEELASAGVRVLRADRQGELAEEVAAGIRERGGAAMAVELHVRDANRFRGFVRETVAKTGHRDYLFDRGEFRFPSVGM
jgi:NAD(P)-dependent dehydrogenase (short-subunit alcohol dehydrogenase family)